MKKVVLAFVLFAVALTVVALVAETKRQSALDRSVEGGSNHAQHVAEAQAGGVVTPDVKTEQSSHGR